VSGNVLIYNVCVYSDKNLTKFKLILLLVCQVPEYVVTRDAVSFPDPMAEYVLGCILARERHLIEHHDNQRIRVW